ncbi:uncharacterized protein LOC103977678 isoform X1 [Musa acuminata AAA Group]|uniref:uncharacterized protein LOC103977678 isoform X1 n=1 Tax=Musa acuminata AAA Group TaxID=214697 RepID=UPI0031CEC073
MHLHQENSFSAGEGDWLSFQYFYLLDIDIFLLRELTAEIELFEEEIANREQHALSLYRSIFDQCISQPVSAHNSGMASPVHSSRGARKHPRIILSSFCSSKKFQFQPFQVLSSIEDAGRTNILLKSKAAYNIGGQIITANCIEYSILCCRISRRGHLSATCFLRPLHWSFLRSCASSDPVVRTYTRKECHGGAGEGKDRNSFKPMYR